MRSAPAIAFDYRPSRRIAACAALACVAAAAAPWASALPLALRAGLCAAALAGGAASIARFLRPPFRRVALRAGGWVLVDAAGAERAARLHSHVRLGPLLVLDFRLAPRGRFRALLAPDNADADVRRRLVPMLARGEVVRAG